MKQYHDLLKDVLENGIESDDRTGTGTISVFGPQLRFDLAKGFPLYTTKKLSLRIIFEELMFFIRGETNIRPLLDRNINIWNKDAYRFYKENNPETKLTIEEYIHFVKTDDEFAEKHGDLGRVYGAQWTDWTNEDGIVVNQIHKLIDDIKHNPTSRRLIVNAWNPGNQEGVALPPCHIIYQCYVREGKLSMNVYMRSNDLFLGNPFNVASYALLTHLLALECGLEVGELLITMGDAHIYKDHIEQVKEQLSRECRELPSLKIKKKRFYFEGYKWEDIELVGYDPHPTIKGVMST